MIDVTNPAAPVEVGSCAAGAALDVAVAGNTAYVADVNYGLRVIDVANPAAPVEVGTCATSNAQRRGRIGKVCLHC